MKNLLVVGIFSVLLSGQALAGGENGNNGVGNECQGNSCGSDPVVVVGPPGPQGPQGEPGAPGDKGDKGDPGVDGTDGADGLDGLNGLNGIDGQDVDPGVVNRLSRNTSQGVALGLAASSHQYDYNYEGLQGSVGGGYYDGENALSVGIGGRVGSTFVNAHFSKSSGGYSGVGVGISFKF